MNWSESYKLNAECAEVQALQFIMDHQIMLGKIVARVQWGLVFGIMGRQHPVPDSIVRLESINQRMQSPAGALFPIKFQNQGDLHIRARDGWEYIGSWVQYWFDTQQKAWHPRLFFDSNAHLVSPLVYFIVHHIN